MKPQKTGPKTKTSTRVGYVNPLMARRAAGADKAAAFTLGLSPKQREVKYYRRESAEEALGVLSHGLQRYILSKGQFSVIEFLYALTEQTGPVHSAISTWTAHGGDIAETHAFLESGRLLSTRWLVDFTFFRRKPAFCGQLRNLFGLDALRVTRTHCKFVCVWNETWSVTVLTSANLNQNPRCENFFVIEDRGLVDFHRAYLDELWAKKPKEEALETSAAAHIRRFEQE